MAKRTQLKKGGPRMPRESVEQKKARGVKREQDWLCFSLVFKERTLDFAATNAQALLDWYLGLAQLIPHSTEPLLDELLCSLMDAYGRHEGPPPVSSRHVERARQGQDLFSNHVSLEPWPEEKIAGLIHHRMEARELEASFRDLVVDQLAGSALEDAVLRTQGEYLRLLWDFATGNPRAE